MNDFHWLDHILFVLLGIAFPMQTFRDTKPQLAKIEDWDTYTKGLLYISNGALLLGLALVAVLVWYFTGKPMSTLGFQLPKAGSWGAGILYAALFLLLYLADVYRSIRSPESLLHTYTHWRENTPFLPENWRDMKPFYFLIFGAAVGEEIIFRGFILTYLLMWFGPSMEAQKAAILLSSAVFAIVHYYQGWKAVAKIGCLSIIFGILFLSTGSLLFPIILHFIIDWLGGYFSIWMTGKIKMTRPDLFEDEEE
ncbi:MAG: CPBP family intramembrane glutamic endopeptidase [Bacteroidota bacterium]